MSTYDDDADESCEICGQEFDDCECPGPVRTPEEQAMAEDEATWIARERVEQAERYEADEAEGRRRFGAACKQMMGLLAANRLPATFDDAREWVRALGYEFDVHRRLDGAVPLALDVLIDRALTDAAGWIDAGFTVPHVILDALFAGADPETARLKIEAEGITVAQVMADDGRLTGDACLLDVFEARGR